MAVSEEKMRIVINNYFKSECNVDTSIREAFEKGFKIGVKKGELTSPGKETERKTGTWIGEGDGYADGNMVYDMWYCGSCGCRFDEWDEKPDWKYCPVCGSYNGDDDDV